jgi:hypothetical protein
LLEFKKIIQNVHQDVKNPYLLLGNSKILKNAGNLEFQENFEFIRKFYMSMHFKDFRHFFFQIPKTVWKLSSKLKKSRLL